MSTSSPTYCRFGALTAFLLFVPFLANAQTAVGCTANAGTPEVGVAYSVTCTATGGVAPYVWGTGGTLPAGVSLGAPTTVIQASDRVVVSGTLTTASAASSFTVTATDNGAVADTATVNYTILAIPSISCVASTAMEVGALIIPFTCTSATGGFGTKSWSVFAGALPGGVSLNTGTGTVTGTPTSAATFNYTIRVTDSASTPQTNDIALSSTVAAAISAATCAPTSGMEVGFAITPFTCTKTGGTGAVTWVVATGALPGGLALNAATGAITGIPTTSGNFSFTVTATDSASTPQSSTSGTINATVFPALTAATCAPTSAMEVGAAITPFTCTTTGGATPFTWSISAGALPGGVSLNTSTGAITGTPTASGPFNYTVSVTDSGSVPQNANTGNLSSTVAAALSISACVPSTGMERTVLITPFTCTSSGGTGTQTWSISSGALPTGLSINATSGVVSGTPSASGTFNYTVSVTDSASTPQTAGIARSSVVAALISSATCAPTTGMEVGFAITPFTCSVTGGVGPITWSVATGALPGGLALNAATGAITGTPTTNGNFSFTVTATDSASTPQSSTSGTINTTVFPALSAASCTPTSAMEVGAAITPFTCTATGGATPFTWSISAGALPGGVSLNAATGAITGTPTTSAVFNYTVSVTDSGSVPQNANTGNLSSTVAAALSIAACVPSTGMARTVLITPFTCTSSGGTGTQTWSISSGALPTGLSLNATTGTISGTPSASGTFNYTVSVTDSASTPQTAGIARTSVVAALISSAACTPTTGMEVGVAATPFTCTAAGGVLPLTWTVASGALPTGLSLNAATGVVSGTPTVSSVFNYTITATDSASATQQSSTTSGLSSTVAPALSAPTCSPAGTLEVGVVYAVTCSVSGGVGPYSWTVNTGSLSPGIGFAGLTSAGPGIAASGTFTTAGSFPFTLKVTDSPNNVASSGVALPAPEGLGGTVIPAPSISCLPVTGPAQVGVPYSAACTVTNGTAPYTFDISTGTLPGGLFTSANGGNQFTVFGTPTANGAYNYTVRVRDSASTIQPATQNFTGTISAGLGISCTPVGGPTEVNVPYLTTCTASNGVAPYNWTLITSGLPAGLTASAATGTTFTISGAPSAAGAYAFTVKLTDTSTVPQTLQQNYLGTITAAPSVSCLPTSGPAGVGVPYSATCTVSGGTAPYTWNTSAGTVPAGLVRTPNSGTTTTISGTPTTGGAFDYTVQVTDSAQTAASVSSPQSASLRFGPGTILATPTISCTPAAPPTGPTQQNVAYSTTCTATGGTGTYSWSISAGALPASLALGAPVGNSVTISGTPTALGAYSYTLTATDTASTPQTASVTYSGTVVPSPSVSCTNTSGPYQTSIAYTTTCTATGGTPGVAGYTWTLPGTVPAGITLGTPSGTNKQTVVISGTPSAPTSGLVPIAYSYQAFVTDNALNASGAPASQTASAAFTGNVVSTVQVTCVPAATTGPTQIGVNYSATCTAAGGTASYSWTLSSGTLPALPAGLSLSAPTGVGNSSITISGSPTAVGAFAYALRVTDTTTVPQTSTINYAGSVVPLPTVTCTNTGGPVETGVSYTSTCTVVGGTPGAGYTWAISAGVLPAGITLGIPSGVNNGTVVVSGSPTVPAAGGATIAYSYRVRATDNAVDSVPVSAAKFDEVSFSGGVVSQPLITCAQAPPTGGPVQVNVAYSSSCSVAGGTPPFTWSVAPGTPPGTVDLPAGVTLGSTTGTTTIISGAPTTQGQLYSYVIKVTDSAPQPKSDTTGTYTGTIRATIGLTCNPPSLQTEVSVLVSATCTVTGGTPPYRFAVDRSVASLGASLSIAATPNSPVRTLSITPGGTSPTAVVLDVFDSAPVPQSQTLQVATNIAPAPSINCDTLSGPRRVGESYSVQCTVFGGLGPYSWNVRQLDNAVGLPAGITQLQNGASFSVSGAPLAAVSSYSYDFQVTDGKEVTVTGPTFSGSIVGAVTLTCADKIGPLEAGLTYTTTCNATGGIKPYSFKLDNAYPELTLTTNGDTTTISGKISASRPAGFFRYTVSVLDSLKIGGLGSSVEFSGNLLAAPSISCNPSIENLEIGVKLDERASCDAQFGKAPYTWKIDDGKTPPVGLTASDALGTQFALTGTPLYDKNATTYTLRLTDALGGTVTRILKGKATSPASITSDKVFSALTFGPSGGNFALQVTNSSDRAIVASGSARLTVEVSLPASIDIASTPQALGWDCTSDSGSRKITCRRIESILLPQTSADLKFTTDVLDNACTADVKYSATLFLGSTALDGIEQVVTNVSGCLLITKTHQGSFPAKDADGKPGAGTYTIKVANATKRDIAAINGQSPIITVEDLISPLLSVDAAAIADANDPRGWKCSAVQGKPATGSTEPEPWLVTCKFSPSFIPGQGASSEPIPDILLPVKVETTKCGFATGPVEVKLPWGTQATTQDATSISGSNCLAISGLFTKVQSATTGMTFAPRELDPKATASGWQYQVTLSNIGEGPFTDPSAVKLTLPEGFVVADYASPTEWNCDTATNPISCALRNPTLDSGETRTLTVYVTPPVDTCGVIAGGQVSLSVNDIAQGNADVTTSVAGSGCLSISRANPKTLSVGIPSTYKLTVTNSGAATGTDPVRVTEALPPGVTILGVASADAVAKWACAITPPGKAFTCTRTGSMPVGVETLNVDFQATTVSCPSIIGTAFVSVGSKQHGATVDLLSMKGCFQLTSVLENPLQLSGTGSYVYTPVYRGSNSLGGTLMIEDILPLGLTYRSAGSTQPSASDWSCSHKLGDDQLDKVNCSRPAAGSYTPLRLEVDVAIDACGSVTNNNVTLNYGGLIQASAATPIQVFPGDSGACPAGQLQLSTTVDPPSTLPNRSVVFTLTVANSGTEDISADTEVVVTDAFIPGLVPVAGGVKATDWKCDVAGLTISCRISKALAAGTAYPPIAITVTPDASVCPIGRDSKKLTFGGKTLPLLTADAVTTVDLKGCIRATPETLTFIDTKVGESSAPQTLTLTSQDATKRTITVPAISVPYSFKPRSGSAECPAGKDCTVVLPAGGNLVLDVVYTPLCIGLGQNTTLNYTTDAGNSAGISIRGNALLSERLSFTSGLFNLSDGQNISPNTSVDLSVRAPGAGYCVAGQPPVTPKLTLVRNPAYDSRVDACASGASSGCIASLTTGTVAGKFALQTQFTQAGKTLDYSNRDDAILNLEVPPSKPVLSSVTKGSATTSSFVVNARGYYTPRIGKDLKACFTFTAASGAVLNSLTGNDNCFGSDEIAVWYERSGSIDGGSQFTLGLTFSFAGDATAIGQADVWLKSATLGDSEHRCLDFKTGNSKPGVCTP